MKSFWIDYKESLKLLKVNSSRFIRYQVITKLIIVTLLTPVFRGIFNLLMKSKGYLYITNGLLQRFIMSPQGIIMGILSIIFAFLVILMELGGLVVLSNQCISGEPENSFIDVTKYLLKKMKYLLGIDGLILSFYFILVAPMLNLNLKASIFDNIKIPGFIMDVINANGFYLTILCILAVCGIILSIRWMFSLHILILNKKDEKHYLRKSGQLVSKNFKYIFRYMLGTGFVQLLVILVLIIGYILFCLITIMIFSYSDSEMIFIILLSVGIILILCSSFVHMPLLVIIQTKLYYQITNQNIDYLNIGTVKKLHFIDKLLKNKYVIVIVSIVYICALFISTYSSFESEGSAKYITEITAHRGSSLDAPENTLSSIKTAVNNGADYAEIDVQETKDGQVILLHDSTFKRTGNVEIAPWELSLKQIKQIDAGSWFSDTYIGEKVPTLEEIIKYSKDKIKLNIEIKSNENSGNLIKKVVSLINEYDLLNECVVTSLKYTDLEKIETLDSRIKTGYIMFIALGNLKELGVDFYSIEETNATESFISEAHSIGRKVHVWTINTQESMENMLSLGVDNIITDYDKDLRSLIDEKNSVFTLNKQ